MVLALDIGGTNIRSGIVNGSKIKDYRKTAMPSNQRDALNKIFEVVESYVAQKCICVSTAGFERDGEIVHSLNNDMDGVALTSILKKRFRTKVFVENDANCAALAELYYGVGKGKKNFVMLTLGSGIGGAIVINGRLYRGNGGAGEIGSIFVYGDLFEHKASGNASVEIAKERMFKSITSLELEKRARSGDKNALAVYQTVGYYLGIGLADLAYIFDPEFFILGGGFSRVKYIHTPARETLKELYDISPTPKIIKAKFGDDAGLIGAGLLFKEKK